VVEHKRIAIYYPAFMGGGAEAVGLWMLEALKQHYHLTLFTVAELDFAPLNAMYGTQLTPQQVRVRSLVSQSLQPIFYHLIANFPAFRMLCIHLLIRYFKAHTQQEDLVISAYNAMDLGRRGIQYIHWIKVLEGNAFYQAISGFSEPQIQQNISLVNSHFIAKYCQQTYGIPSTVVFPPVTLNPADIPWQQKQNAFICSGRLVKAKEPHRVIQILAAVRQQGYDIKLHMTGGGGGVYEKSYQNYLRKIIQCHADWIVLHENLNYQDYTILLSQCKYGIHFKKEPFGISVAEMVKAGAIPFVRNKGGQVEIVGAHHPELLFETEAEAIAKILHVLQHAEEQQRLIQSLTQQKDLFSTQRFMSEIQQTVEQFFSN
jgi:glycosyltransferase involved in cell wall biosynthesis